MTRNITPRPTRGDWIVDFNRGDGMGMGQYTLKSNTYKFKQTARGWELTVVEATLV